MEDDDDRSDKRLYEVGKLRCFRILFVFLATRTTVTTMMMINTRAMHAPMIRPSQRDVNAELTAPGSPLSGGEMTVF